LAVPPRLLPLDPERDSLLPQEDWPALLHPDLQQWAARHPRETLLAVRNYLALVDLPEPRQAP
jgi:hypothetical protein